MFVRLFFVVKLLVWYIARYKQWEENLVVSVFVVLIIIVTNLVKIPNSPTAPTIMVLAD